MMRSGPSRFNLRKIAYTRPWRVFITGFFKENAVCYQVLGLCSTLAVSNKMENAVAMGASVIFVMLVSSTVISLLRRVIPTQYRIITYMIVTSTFVIIIDQFLKANFPTISGQLGPYVGLIITNCIVMGRQEAFAIKNGVGLSILDSLGAALSYSYVLVGIAAVREFLGFGSLLGVKVTPPHFENWVVISMAQGAWFVMAIFVWGFRRIAKLKPLEQE
jgi:Na+-transporting NADH:ubiquinone oxidoreductase subunit D